MSLGPDAQFRQALAAGKFIIKHCRDCGGYNFYPRVLCPACGSDGLMASEACGKGVVYSTTVVRNRPEKGGDFNVCLVELHEGPRVMSRVEETDPGSVRIGMEVEAFIGEVAGEANVLFRPAGAHDR